MDSWYIGCEISEGVIRKRNSGCCYEGKSLNKLVFRGRIWVFDSKIYYMILMNVKVVVIGLFRF